MTLSEFRAFLDGMDVGYAPTPEQWARIKEKIETLQDDVPSPRLPYEYWPNTCKVTAPFDPNVTLWNAMEPLGADFVRVWDGNTDKLYEV